MSRGTALGRVTKCLKDHHVDTTKKLKKAPKEWQELFICDRESHEREGEARIFTLVLKTWGSESWRTSGAISFRIPRSGQQGDETVEPVGGGEAKGNSCDSVILILIMMVMILLLFITPITQVAVGPTGFLVPPS